MTAATRCTLPRVSGSTRSPVGCRRWRWLAVGPGNGHAPAVLADRNGGYESWFPAGRLVRDQDGYEADVRECQRQLNLGERYEICLTNRLHLPCADDDLAFY